MKSTQKIGKDARKKPSDNSRTKNKQSQDTSETMAHERVKREITTEEVIIRRKEGWKFIKKKRGDSQQIVARRKIRGITSMKKCCHF
jgi:hypothetical protein